MGALFAVREAVLAKLKAELPAVDGRAVAVYRHPPENMAFPAVTLDRVIDEPDDLIAERVSRLTLSFTLWSGMRGSREIEGMREGIRAVLHDAALAPAEGQSVMCRYVRGDVTRDGDGVTYMGSVLISVIVEH